MTPDSHVKQSSEKSSSKIADRQSRLAVLARCTASELEPVAAELMQGRTLRHIKPPEAGLAMIRARAGGTGRSFNFSEITVTRCVVVLGDGDAVGVGYTSGHDRRKAELIAIVDAGTQLPGGADRLDQMLLGAKRAEISCMQKQRAAEVAATKVDFFTLVRGED